MEGVAPGSDYVMFPGLAFRRGLSLKLPLVVVVTVNIYEILLHL